MNLVKGWLRQATKLAWSMTMCPGYTTRWLKEVTSYVRDWVWQTSSGSIWTHLERANIVAHHIMGTPRYMHLVRQRVGAIGTPDATDANRGHETGESETQEDDMEIEVENSNVQYGQSIQEMYETLEQGQRLCLIDGENRDASTIQNLLLAVLQTTQTGLTAQTARPLRNRVAMTSTDMAGTARNQGRWNSAERFQAVAAIYSGWNRLQSNFFGKMWISENWDTGMTGSRKATCVKQRSMLTTSRRSEKNFRSYTWDWWQWDTVRKSRWECNKFSHICAWKDLCITQAPFGWKETLPASHLCVQDCLRQNCRTRKARQWCMRDAKTTF